MGFRREMKYIVFEHDGEEIFVTFTQWVEHDKFAAMFPRSFKPVRAGYVDLVDGKLHCNGLSVTLHLESAPDDSAALNRQLGYAR